MQLLVYQTVMKAVYMNEWMLWRIMWHLSSKNKISPSHTFQIQADNFQLCLLHIGVKTEQRDKKQKKKM